MSSECDAALVKQSIVSSEGRLSIDYSWMKLVTKDNYESVKDSASAVVPGYFDGDYDHFSEKRESNSSYEKLSYSLDEARSSFMAYFQKEAYQAWSDCMVNKGRDRLIVGAYDASAESAVIVIRWEPLENTLGPLVRLRVTVKGGSIDGGQNLALASATPEGAGNFVGQQSFAVTRESSTSSIVVMVNGQTRTGLSVQGYCTVFPPSAPPELESWSFAYGRRDDVTELTPSATRARRIAISARSTDAFEQWGNPWHELEVLVDGGQVWIAREGTQSNENELKMPERIYNVPAGKQHTVRLIHRGEFTKATGMWLSIRELD
jgi:hypothetical protein